MKLAHPPLPDGVDTIVELAETFGWEVTLDQPGKRNAELRFVIFDRPGVTLYTFWSARNGVLDYAARHHDTFDPDQVTRNRDNVKSWLVDHGAVTEAAA